MFRRVSSAFLQLIRSSSALGANVVKKEENATRKSLQEEVVNPTIALSEERKDFEAVLEITSQDDPILVNLPHTITGFIITEEGHLRVYVNAGLVSDEEKSFHDVLRKNPGIALRIKTLHLIIQGPKQIDLDQRDSTFATQRKGLAEWSKTVPALKNLTQVKISHLSADEKGIYVPGEDVAEKEADEDQKGLLDASVLMKVFAWYGEKLEELELEAVDMSEEAAKAFEGSNIKKLRLEGCPTRVLTIIPRLTSLADVTVVERGEISVGSHYLGLLAHVKSTLTAISLKPRDSKIDLQEFLTTFSGSRLTVIDCPFATDLAPEEVEQKLKESLPSYGAPEQLTSEDTKMDASTEGTDATMEVETASTTPARPLVAESSYASTDIEMSPLPNGRTTPTRKSAKRSAIVEKKKEELKVAEIAAAKDKVYKVGDAARKSKRVGTPSRQK